MPHAQFIVLEGPDGSGHSTQAELLKNYFEKSDRKVLLTKEPALIGLTGKKIKAALDEKSKISPLALQKLFIADRKNHLKQIITPSLKKGLVVISDRYFFSTIAYGGLSIPVNILKSMNSGFPLPDFTFILKTKPETCIKRIQKRGQPIQFFETKEKLTRVLTNYLKLAKEFPNTHIINGEQSIKKVHKNIICKIDS